MKKCVLNPKNNDNEKLAEVIELKSASIITMLIKDNIATLSWLGITDKDEMIIINIPYKIESDKEIDFINKLIFCSNNDTTLPNAILYETLLKNIQKVYTSNINFSIIFNKVIVDAVNTNNDLVNIYLDSELFASLAFVEDYIMNFGNNNYEFSNALMSARFGSKSDIIFINNINYIVSLAKAKVTKNSTSIAAIFRVTESKTNNEYTLMVPFTIDAKFKDSKFKGMKIDKIEENYLKNSDEYLSIYSFNTRIDNADKEYTVYKASNKKGEKKLFFLDTNVMEQLQNKIKDF